MSWSYGGLAPRQIHLDEVNTTFMDQQSATLGDSVREAPILQIGRIWEQAQAELEGPYIQADEARKRAEAEGIRLEFGDNPLSEAVFEIMMQRARERRIRESVISRGPQGALATGASFFTAVVAQLWDPINIATAFVPVVGPARYTQLVASAGRSAVGRAGVRVGIGAGEGVVGQTLVEPFAVAASTMEGQDYGMANTLANIAFGAAFGAALHPPVGAFLDFRQARADTRQMLRAQQMEAFERVWLKSMPQPSSLVGEHVIPAEAVLRRDQAVAPAERTEGLAPRRVELERGSLAGAWNEVLEKLPPESRRDAFRAAVASGIQGRPARMDTFFQAAAAKDPEVKAAVGPLLARSEGEVQVSGDNISLVGKDGKTLRSLAIKDADFGASMILDGDLANLTKGDLQSMLAAAALRSLEQGKPLRSGSAVPRAVLEAINELRKDGFQVRIEPNLKRLDNGNIVAENGANPFIILSRRQGPGLADHLEEARQFNEDVAAAPSRLKEAPTNELEPEPLVEPTKPSEDLVAATENYRVMREAGVISDLDDLTIKNEIAEIDKAVEKRQQMYKDAAACLVINHG